MIILIFFTAPFKPTEAFGYWHPLKWNLPLPRTTVFENDSQILIFLSQYLSAAKLKVSEFTRLLVLFWLAKIQPLNNWLLPFYKQNSKTRKIFLKLSSLAMWKNATFLEDFQTLCSPQWAKSIQIQTHYLDEKKKIQQIRLSSKWIGKVNSF